MNISEAAKASGVSAKMIRYYEKIGLVRSVGRTAGNYRTFDINDVRELAFIKRARSLGLPVEHIARLLSLWRGGENGDVDLREVVNKHVAELKSRMDDMQAIADTLLQLVDGFPTKDLSSARPASANETADRS